MYIYIEILHIGKQKQNSFPSFSFKDINFIFTVHIHTLTIIIALKNCVSLTASYNLYVYGKAESAWKTCMVRMERCTQKNRYNREYFPCFT